MFFAPRAPQTSATRGWFPPRGNRPGGPARPALIRAHAGLGIPVAVLAAAGPSPSITVQTEAVAALGAPKQRVAEVRLTYPDGLDLITYRLDRGDPVFYLAWQALTNHRMAAAAPPDRPSPRAGTVRPVTVDGSPAQWQVISAAAGSQVAACAGIVGAAIIVAAGPQEAVDNLAIKSWPAPSR